MNTNHREERSPKGGSIDARGQELNSMFRQHPDLFRDESLMPTAWSEAWQANTAHTVQTMLIKEHGFAGTLREHLLSDSRIQLCATAERLGDACRKIRQHSYQVIVLAISEHIQDIVPLLDLMNSSNPRAKAIAVLEQHASERLEHMLHPKVLGYVAAHDAAEHLTDAVLEVAQGRFTASPAISGVVMQLTTNYLAARQPASATRNSRASQQAMPSSVQMADQHSGETSGFAPSSHMHSSFSASGFTHSLHAVSSFGGSGFANLAIRDGRSLLSEREHEILQLIAGGLSSAEIADELGISVPTVNTHVRNMFTKLGVRTRAQAIHTGITQGLIMVE